ncbi:MAG TPA: N,N-dimethylformamidase beta subunit family domain-containing protein, partial [Candidatus Methylomirabilis sp.]|nr:N,N-dimethylformamidase beta subunit family domain-containing protein [Candidatus Methylomirabilis sp.]
LLLSVGNQTGLAQGYWDGSTSGIVGCSTCTSDPQTGMIDTHWKYTYSLSIPSTWVSGDYLVKLTDQTGAEGYINFILRDDERRSSLLAQVAVNTYQAYNNWGGYSLYAAPAKGQIAGYGAKPAVKVSFNRPIVSMDPFKIFYDVQAVRFLERSEYDVSYTTSVAVDQNPGRLSGHKAFISIGHDEYWTRAMRDGVEQARDQGVNLAFWGGNDVYWQARLEPDLAGNPRRVLVVYRDAALDPLAASDPKNATVRFIDPPVSHPQNSLTGTIFGGIIENPPGVPWVVAPTAPADLLEGTGLQPGTSVPALTGKECDSVAGDDSGPAGLQVMAASPMLTNDGQHIVCDTTLYQASSGAWVFNAGTLSWTMALDGFGHHNPGLGEEPPIQRLTQNVLALFGVQPAVILQSPVQ